MGVVTWTAGDDGEHEVEIEGYTLFVRPMRRGSGTYRVVVGDGRRDLDRILCVARDVGPLDAAQERAVTMLREYLTREQTRVQRALAEIGSSEGT